MFTKWPKRINYLLDGHFCEPVTMLTQQLSPLVCLQPNIPCGQDLQKFCQGNSDFTRTVKKVYDNNNRKNNNNKRDVDYSLQRSPCWLHPSLMPARSPCVPVAAAMGRTRVILEEVPPSIYSRLATPNRLLCIRCCARLMRKHVYFHAVGSFHIDER